MESSVSVEINRPLPEVFRYTNENVSDWSITVVENEVIEETPGKVGSRFRLLTQDRGREMEMTGEVTRYEENRLSEVFMVGQGFEISALYIFEDLGNEVTRVTETARVHPKGVMRIFFFLFGWFMKKSSCDALQNELESLKEKLESGVGATPH